MKRNLGCFSAATILAILAWSAIGSKAVSGEAPQQAAQVIVLKLDDVTTNGAREGEPVSRRWQRVVDLLRQRELKASFGVIGYSLEEDNPVYFDWIKKLHAEGIVEFWNHGYRNRKATDKMGEFEGAFEEQQKAVQQTQALSKQKLGIELKTFGPHWSGTNEHTGKVLDGFPEIKVWFHGRANASSKLVLPRVLTLENPIFVPDPEKFKELYEQRAQDKKYLALQGHPNAWDDRRWEGFVKIVDFLQSQGCVFVTPSEYLEMADSSG